MTALLANIFLGCFIVGFLLSVGTFLFGVDSDTGTDGGGGPDVGGAGGDVGGAGADGGGIDVDGGHHHGMPLPNFNSISLFLTWFGAVGYILNSEAKAGPLVSLLGAIIFGFLGAMIIVFFMNKFLMKGDTTIRASDYYLPGTLARITSTIRPGGAGEIVYVQGGTRKTAGARSDEDATHPFGQEVVIVRYEKGLAYVRAVNPDELGSMSSGVDPETTL